MKPLSIAIIILATTSIFIGCGGHDSSSSSDNVNITLEQLSSTIDPVCKMGLENNAIADTAVYKGKIYGFCSSGCKETFTEDPEQYIAEQ